MATFAAFEVLAAGAAGAQVADNRATAYLHPTSVTDGRAVWLNPAGPAASARASLYLDVTVRNPGALGRLGQLTAGFNSRGLSFGYQRDVFPTVTGHTYRVGLATSAHRFAFGAAVALYRGGGTASTGWDLGLRYVPAPAVTLGGTIANLSEPVVRGLRQRLTFVPGATLAPFGPVLELSTHARMTRDAVLGYAFGVQWHAMQLPLAAIVRLDTDNQLRRAAFAFGLAIGRQNSIGAVATTSGDFGDTDAVSLYGLVSRSIAR